MQPLHAPKPKGTAPHPHPHHPPTTLTTKPNNGRLDRASTEEEGEKQNMIGLRQDPLSPIQQQCKKKMQFHPLSITVIGGDVNIDGNGHNASQTPKSNINTAASNADGTTTTTDGADALSEEGAYNKITEDRSVFVSGGQIMQETDTKAATANDANEMAINEADVFAEEDEDEDEDDIIVRNEVESNRSDGDKTSSQHARESDVRVAKRDQHQQYQRRSIQKSSRIQLSNTESSWKSFLRDIITAVIPLFVLYKISTHPMVANLGYQDPNAPKKYSQKENLEQMMFSLHLKEQQTKLQKKHFFLDAIDKRNCYNIPVIDIPAQMAKMKMKQSDTSQPRRRKFKGKDRRPGSTATGVIKAAKRNMPMARLTRNRAPPTSTPVMSSLASAIRGDPPSPATTNNVNKGTEAERHDNNHEGNHKGGKKGDERNNRRTPKKKKFGRRILQK